MNKKVIETVVTHTITSRIIEFIILIHKHLKYKNSEKNHATLIMLLIKHVKMKPRLVDVSGDEPS